ncbi:MAG: M14 family zinc carboxypeptidase [Brumimicrobium sp.]|nr:M14 family zinc carboxypeptidase [Brumimicrobium sp.]
MIQRIFTIFTLLIINLAVFSQENYSRARIWTTNAQIKTLSDLGLAVDHASIKDNTFIISDFSESEINLVREAGFKVDILIEDVKSYYVERAYQDIPSQKNLTCPNTQGSTFNPTVPSNFTLGSMAGFYTYQEYLDILDDMYAQYPNLITQRSAISDTLSHEGREIYYVKISNNPNVDQGKPRVLYTSLHHAREPGSLSETIFFMWYMLENYGTDPEVTYLVDSLEIFCVPMINPDGYVHNVVNDPNGGGMHRKNKNPNVGSTNPGVDLNRNYSYQWGTTGVSANQDSDVYPGSGPFSEPETQNMKKIAENWNITLAFNAHTHGGLLLFPIGATNNEFAADHTYFDDITRHMVRFSGYDQYKSSGLYPASGDSDDYMYKTEGIFAMTPEVSFDGFWAPASVITDDCIDMLFPNLTLAHLALVYGVTEDADLSSSVTTMTGDFNHQIQRLGRQAGPLTVSIEPLNGIQSVGNSITYNLLVEEIQTGAISYILNPTIQYGDEIKYVLTTDNGAWIKRDTIIKTFGSATLQFTDNAANADNWTGDWDLTTEDFYSADYSFTDSPGADYFQNTFSEYVFNDTVDLTNATAAAVRFRAKWDIEDGWDYVQFQVSTDFGNTWIPQCGKYTNPGVQNQGTPQPVGEPLYDGTQSSWVLEEINFSDYLGEKIMMRFILISDEYVQEDGYYFDDFELLYDLDDTGIGNDLSVDEFRLMPNPAKDEVKISFANVMNEGIIEIFDATGKMVINSSFTELTNLHVIDLKNLDAGVYFVHFQTGGKRTQPKRLVVTK